MLKTFDGVVKIDSQGAYLSVSHQQRSQFELGNHSSGLRIPHELTSKFPIKAGDVVTVALDKRDENHDGHPHTRVYIDKILKHEQPEATLEL